MQRARLSRCSRPGVIIVVTAVMLTVVIGFAALAIDLGQMYLARDQLQVAADAAALAAVQRLSQRGSVDEVLDMARAEAAAFAAKHTVMGKPVGINPQSDVEFGGARLDEQSGKMVFVPGSFGIGAVKITIRMAKGAANEPLPTFFAGVFGHTETELSVQSIATFRPRDIMAAIDLSGSMNFDSRLSAMYRGDVNLMGLWADLGDPTFGTMATWGDDLNVSTYDPNSDPGLVYLNPRDRNHNHSRYDEIMNALNLEWGAPDTPPPALPPQPLDEVPDTPHGVAVPPGHSNRYPFDSGNWYDYFRYVRYQIQPRRFRNHYGLKTFIDYLVVKKGWYNQAPLFMTRQQPVFAAKHGLNTALQLLHRMENSDQIGLVSYGGYARLEHELTQDELAVAQEAWEFQAGEYQPSTNIGDGLKLAINELQSSRGRPFAQQVIFLLTDGVANRGGDGLSPRDYALAQATRAGENDIIIYAISLGYGADRSLMQEIVARAHKRSEEYNAAGSVEEYTAELQAIFSRLSGAATSQVIQ